MTPPTPMMQQYLEIKAQFPDALLFYRMGDFYELFLEDALIASRELEITLTSRDKNADNPVPMCGVPYHAADTYIPKLIRAGHKVAICDQVEDPKKAKGLVRREVTRVITPGLIVENQNLEAKQANYLASIAWANRGFALAFIDVSTAEFKVTQLDDPDQLAEELLRIAPRELLMVDGEPPAWLKAVELRLGLTITRLDPGAIDPRRARERLCRHFHVHSLEGFGIGPRMAASILAAGAILDYLRDNRLGDCSHISKLTVYRQADFMLLDDATVRNLEIFQSTSFQGRKGSLLELLDRTQTAMGARKLQQWLRYPRRERERIERRQEAVAELVDRAREHQGIVEKLAGIADLERLTGRISVAAAGPRDLLALKKSLLPLPALETDLKALTAPRIRDLLSTWDNLTDLAERIAATLVDDPPPTLNGGGVIRAGVDPDLDRYTRLSFDAKGWMAHYETEERRRTGINSLKVRYNKVFGYYIEISRANLEAAPPHYVRKQTLVNAERYITDELKVFETQVLEADEKRLELETRLFDELRRRLAEQGARLLAMADTVAVLDVLSSLAEVARVGDYCRPQLLEDGSITIKDGRHPVIEHFLDAGSFVPNDLVLNQEDQQVLIITGPNMSGKSTILRQAALIVLLTHIGGFVPARSAAIGLVDRIFSRVGAADDLHRGRSTFLVEMQETANILHQATPRSFIILDEIGRGTATFDGLSLAWAVAEYLHGLGDAGAKTLFATHYHELTELAQSLPRVKNFNVAVKEWQQDILFFHKLVPGGSNRSYGIQVARLAGVPDAVVERAREVLARLEGPHHAPPPKPASAGRTSPARTKPRAGFQLSLFRPSAEWLLNRLQALDLERMTPLAALQTLYAIKEQIKKETDA